VCGLSVVITYEQFVFGFFGEKSLGQTIWSEVCFVKSWFLVEKLENNGFYMF